MKRKRDGHTGMVNLGGTRSSWGVGLNQLMPKYHKLASKARKDNGAGKSSQAKSLSKRRKSVSLATIKF